MSSLARWRVEMIKQQLAYSTHMKTSLLATWACLEAFIIKSNTLKEILKHNFLFCVEKMVKNNESSLGILSLSADEPDSQVLSSHNYKITTCESDWWLSHPRAHVPGQMIITSDWKL